MNIYYAMIKGDSNLRITNGNRRWMYWDGNETSEWVVLERPIGSRKNITLYRGESEEAAVKALLADEVD